MECRDDAPCRCWARVRAAGWLVDQGTRYELLYDALDGLHDDAHLGRVQYGTNHLTDRFNDMEFITTKESKYCLLYTSVLAAAGYNPPGLVFPVSASILREISAYRGVLAVSYTHLWAVP